MVRAGRKPQGWKLIEHVSGDESCKARVRAFLATMTGQCTVDEACQGLGIKPSRFFLLRNEWLERSVGLLEPKPVGRPRKTSAEDPQVAELKQQVQALERRALAAELRAKLAEARVAKSTATSRKKGARR